MFEAFFCDAEQIPVLFFTLFFGLDLLVFFLVENLAFVGAWMVIGIFPKACICAFGHHQQHIPTFHRPNSKLASHDPVQSSRLNSASTPVSSVTPENILYP